MRFIIIAIFAALSLCGSGALAKGKTIGVFVALADPDHTGIEKLPKSIGDGDNAETNLYWGNDEGLKGTFDHSKKWKLVEKNETPQADVVMSTRTYRRTGSDLTLVARAYRGSQMQKCVQDYEDAVAHGSYDLVVFIGHDGLMDFQLPMPQRAADQARKPDCVALCCVSEQFFKQRLTAAGGHPVLLTTQLMYPGSFTLEALADTWAAGGTPAAIRESAAGAYAHNQKISKKAALGVFAELKE
ncbi:MAG TPA: hypothetical protein VG733_09890 [Chthoniobacteraceae bacterium]|nr:hypothetical protein [Chthoniobacteraceae bacterium]